MRINREVKELTKQAMAVDHAAKVSASSAPSKSHHVRSTVVREASISSLQQGSDPLSSFKVSDDEENESAAQVSEADSDMHPRNQGLPMFASNLSLSPANSIADEVEEEQKVGTRSRDTSQQQDLSVVESDVASAVASSIAEEVDSSAHSVASMTSVSSVSETVAGSDMSSHSRSHSHSRSRQPSRLSESSNSQTSRLSGLEESIQRLRQSYADKKRQLKKIVKSRKREILAELHQSLKAKDAELNKLMQVRERKETRRCMCVCVRERERGERSCVRACDNCVCATICVCVRSVNISCFK